MQVRAAVVAALAAFVTFSLSAVRCYAPSHSLRPASAARSLPPPSPRAEAPTRVGGGPSARIDRGTRTPNGRWTGVPRIDTSMRDRLVVIAATGARNGMRRDVFAKIGDSITESASFLQDIGHGWYDLGPFATLAETIAVFHRNRVDGDGNDSFAHASHAASMGWTAHDALEGPPPDPVDRELEALRPSIAFVMFGTNDADRSSPADLQSGLERIVERCLRRGIIPVLSTVPDRSDSRDAARRVVPINVAIRHVAESRGVPVIDLNAALEDLPSHGLDSDGMHPSAFVREGDTRAAEFGVEALRYGYNVRNLVTLQTLDALRRIVFEHETPDL